MGFNKRRIESERAAAAAKQYLSRSLSLQHVSAFMLEKIQRHVAVGGVRAAGRMVKLVDAAKSEHVQFDSARFLLGVAGIKPTSEAQPIGSTTVNAGYVIILSPRSGDPPQPGDIIVSSTKPTALPAPAADEHHGRPVRGPPL